MKELKLDDLSKIILEAILMAVFATVVTFLFNWISKSDISINVTSSVYVNNNYACIIDIKNFSKSESQNDITIYISPDINISSWESNTQSKQAGSNIVIGSIAPDSSNSVLIWTNESLDATNIKISSKAKSSITFLEKQRSLSKTLIITLIANIGALFLAYTITFTLLEKKRRERQIEREKQDAERKVLLDQLSVQLAKAKNEAKERVSIQKETQLFYAARFADYSRELGFWKDTVRKLIYSFGKSKIEADCVFDTITDSLKTYTTKEVTEQNFETINYIARRIAQANKAEKKQDE